MNAENTKRDNATLWIVVPFALAIVGTVVMLFTNSANALKVSLILALWAAVAGIILVARLRRDRDQAQRELVARSERFEAELDAAQARGEADRVLLERARSGSDTASSIDVEVLREIQAELARLRAQLEELSGRYFEYEPAALRAQARRIAELEANAGSSRFEPAEQVETAEQADPAELIKPVLTPEPVEPVSKPVSGPSTEDTAEIKKVRDRLPEPEKPVARPAAAARAPEAGVSRPVGAPSFDAIEGRFGSRRETLQDSQNPLSQLISERQQESVAEPEPTPKPQPAPQPEPQAPADHHGGRRRRDEHGRSSLTVAELLARSKRETD